MKWAAFSSFNRWESKDLSIWRVHSCLIFERKVHISFSGCHTETARLHSAKGFLCLILNKSLKPISNKPRKESQTQHPAPKPVHRAKAHSLCRRKTASLAFACRKTYKSPFISHEEKPEKYIICKVCRRPRGKARTDFTECSLGGQEILMEKMDCQMLGKFFSWQGKRKTIYLVVVRYCYRPVILDG